MSVPEVSYKKRCELFARDPNENWGGRKVRTLLHCVYVFAFLCLLRSDEVFRIKFEDIEIINKLRGHIVLNLPFRKTHQHGGTSISHPFLSPFFDDDINEVRPRD
jgi:hypothetical protein